MLQYNTKKNDETGDITTIFTNLSDDEKDKIEIIKGSMYYATTNKKEIEWLKQIGVEPNPYDIENGVLKSSFANLMLMDDTGTVTIPGNVTKIASGAFRNLNGLKTIIIPSSVTEIESYAFSGNSTLENVIFSDGLTTIGDFAFQDCISLKSISLPDTVTTLGSTCFGSCTSLANVKLSANLTSIPYRLFSACNNLKNVDIPEKVTRIGEAVFEHCKNLEYITISKNVTNIGIGLFYNTPKLSEIRIDPQNTVFTFKDGLLLSNNKTILKGALDSITNVIVPDTVTTIEYINGHLEQLYISSNVEKILPYFPETLRNISVSSNNKKFKAMNGNLYDYSVSTLIKYCSNDSVAILPDTVKTIKDKAFVGQENISQLVLPKNLTTLCDYSLRGLKLNELNLPENVEILNSTVFAASDISKITISDSNQNISCINNIYITSKDKKTLYAVGNLNLTEYTVPDSVEKLNVFSLYSAARATKVILPSSLKNIETSAFDYAISLTTIEIPGTVENIGNDAFSRCNALTKIIVKKSKNSISGSPWGCPYGDKAVIWEP